jgi:hypothetical protein
MSTNNEVYEQAIIDTVAYQNPNQTEVVPGWFEVANEEIGQTDYEASVEVEDAAASYLEDEECR